MKKINPEWEKRKGVYCALCRKSMAQGLGKCFNHTIIGIEKYIEGE